MDDRDGRPLHERVAALERTITDGHVDDGLPETARMDARLDDLEATVEGFDDRIAELDAAVQALRGFAGGIRAVDEAVERRADAAVARVDRLEAELEQVREEMSGPGDASAVAEPNGRTGVERTRHEPCADARSAPARDESIGHHDQSPSRADASDGTDTRNRHRGGSLHDDVGARTDAALADAAAMADEGEETEDGRSLADRLRGLL